MILLYHGGELVRVHKSRLVHVNNPAYPPNLHIVLLKQLLQGTYIVHRYTGKIFYLGNYHEVHIGTYVYR